MIKILLTSIKADRTGNFILSLEAIKDMLPYLAAAGRTSYTKCAMMYVQHMESLRYTDPKTFHDFSAGKYTIRRTDKYWAGLPQDLVIEQTLI